MLPECIQPIGWQVTSQFLCRNEVEKSSFTSFSLCKRGILLVDNMWQLSTAILDAAFA